MFPVIVSAPAKWTTNASAFEIAVPTNAVEAALVLLVPAVNVPTTGVVEKVFVPAIVSLPAKWTTKASSLLIAVLT